MCSGARDVVGRTRDQRRVCGAVGRRSDLSAWHGSFRISYGRIEADCSFIAKSGVFFDMTYAAANLALLPIRAGFRGPRALGKKFARPLSHTATQPHGHRPSISSDRLQLSYFKLSLRGSPHLTLLSRRLRTSTEARQPLEFKCIARDRMMI
jgi:hypothetical protein